MTGSKVINRSQFLFSFGVENCRCGRSIATYMYKPTNIIMIHTNIALTIISGIAYYFKNLDRTC
jgi:hypothetical protein